MAGTQGRLELAAAVRGRGTRGGRGPPGSRTGDTRAGAGLREGRRGGGTRAGVGLGEERRGETREDNDAGLGEGRRGGGTRAGAGLGEGRRGETREDNGAGLGEGQRGTRGGRRHGTTRGRRGRGTRGGRRDPGAWTQIAKRGEGRRYPNTCWNPKTVCRIIISSDSE
jgi:hypothetical protein